MKGEKNGESFLRTKRVEIGLDTPQKTASPFQLLMKKNEEENDADGFPELFVLVFKGKKSSQARTINSDDEKQALILYGFFHGVTCKCFQMASSP